MLRDKRLQHFRFERTFPGSDRDSGSGSSPGLHPATAVSCAVRVILRRAKAPRRPVPRPAPRPLPRSTICATPSISSPSSLLVDALADPQRRFDVRREIRLVAEMAAAAHHREIHADLPAQRDDREDIDVVVAADFDRLLMQHGRQRAHLVAHRRGLLEFQLGGEAMHLLLEFLHHFALPAEQETRCIRHIARVILVADQADARRRAAPDLMQQARPRAVGEHRVLAGAQLEHALQDLDAFAHGPRARERPEVLVLLVDRAAVIRHARKLDGRSASDTDTTCRRETGCCSAASAP